jgi:cellulose synthase/poly-beta-1,6-N-acetylglucosamine synthase-like glycosyltransferase
VLSRNYAVGLARQVTSDMIELIPTSSSEWETYSLSMLVAGFFLCVAPCLPRQQTWARLLIIAIALAVSVRYLVWRLWDTVLPADLASAAGVWYVCVYLVEVISFVNYSIFYLMLSRWKERSSEANRYERALRRRPVDELPSVDVFIPTYNEGPDVLHRTILAAKRIDYPNFKVWVLDDGRRDWLEEYCAEQQVYYVRRPDRSHAKAGNINHGLSVTCGELFAILDADFAASRNFLSRTVGFFSDPRIAIVQTPQHFFNPDPIQLNLGLSRVLPDDQRLFFEVLAQCRDAWNLAFCCGSCSVQRREAIQAIGGIPTGSITEDIFSSLVLLRKGYITRYLNERLTMGLAAESLAGYFTQRTRWCRGALQMLFLKEGPLGPGLSLLQRLFFFPLDWLVQYPVRLLGIIISIVFLWTGVGPFLITSLDDLICYQLPMLLALGWTMRFFAPNCYVPILSTAISLFGSLRLVPTALATLIKPFGAPFRVTPKGRNNTESSTDAYALFALGVLAALTLGGIVLNRINPDLIPGGQTSHLVAEVFAIVNLILLALAAAMALEMPRSRRGERFPVHHHGTLSLAEEDDLPCVVLNLSETGALLGKLEGVDSGEYVELDIPAIGLISVRVVRCTEAGVAVEFVDIEEGLRLRIIDFIYSSGLCNEVRRLRLLEVISSLFRFLLGMQTTGRGLAAVPPAPALVHLAHRTDLQRAEVVP